MCDANGKCDSCSRTASTPGSGKILAYNIRMNGFGMLYSFAELPSFVYTAGIEASWGHPELIVFGLDYDSSTRLINETVRLIREGVSLDYQGIDHGIEGMTVKLHEVPYDIAVRYMCETATYYGEKRFRVLQLLWPDKQGRFPIEPGCSDNVKKAQPIIS